MSEWTTVIKPKSSLLSVDFGEIFKLPDKALQIRHIEVEVNGFCAHGFTLSQA